MKKIITLFLTLVSLSLFSCHKKIYNETEILGASMRIVLSIDDAKQYQLDSLIEADNLPSINKWPYTSFIDYETNKSIVKKTLVKTNKEEEIVYIITGSTAPYDIIKRIRK